MREIASGLIEAWECANLQELSAVLGAKITPVFIDKAVRGADIGVNPIALLALISFADGVIAARRQEDARILRPVETPRVAKDSTPLALLEVALEAAGLPTTIADRLGNGCSLSRVSVDERIPYPRLKRQIKWIFEQNVDDFNSAASLGPDESRVHENLQTLKRKLQAPIQANNVFERDDGRGIEQLRGLNRSKVCRYLEQGVRTRKELHYKNSDLGYWCRQFDAEWFGNALPVIPQSKRKGVGRKKGPQKKVSGVD